MIEQLVDRPYYRKQLEDWFKLNQHDLVKIVTGVRRCGKSKLLALFQESLKNNFGVQPDQIISINLELSKDVEAIGLVQDSKTRLLRPWGNLLHYVESRLKPGGINYVFIDEIQLLENWQQPANDLRAMNNVDCYLTGSNAYMFSSDLSNFFGGRYVEIKMLPVSFKEYVSAYDMGIVKLDTSAHVLGNQNLLYTSPLALLYNKYVLEGGFPQTLEFNGNQGLISDYLMNVVYENTIEKDIVKRFNLKSGKDKLNPVVKYMFDTIGQETSLNNIVRNMKTAGYDISVPTLSVYVQGLKESFLLYECSRYDIKGKQYLNTNSKYYAIDTGLRNALLGHEDTDYGRILENVVYLELLRRGYKVYVGKINQQKIGQNNGTIEVDFVAERNGTKEYYQVAWTIVGNDDLMRREYNSLESIKDSYPKYVLSMDLGNANHNGIQRLNVLDWLLKDI